MNLVQLFADEDAVSPVIGVILMVAVTVILAAVIGAFVLDLGAGQEVAPQATYDWSQENDPNDGELMTLSHTGGDSIASGNIGVEMTDGFPGGTAVVNNPEAMSDWASGDDVSAGDEITFGTSGTVKTNRNSGNFIPGDEIRVTWESDDGSSSAILTTYTVN